MCHRVQTGKSELTVVVARRNVGVLHFAGWLHKDLPAVELDSLWYKVVLLRNNKVRFVLDQKTVAAQKF